MVKYFIIAPLKLVFLTPFINSGFIYGVLFKPGNLDFSELKEFIKEELK